MRELMDNYFKIFGTRSTEVPLDFVISFLESHYIEVHSDDEVPELIENFRIPETHFIEILTIS